MNLSAADVIRLLALQPHPEGGHFREMFRDTTPVDGARSASTAIYYLLRHGERSHWHRVDAAEVWHFYGGDPLLLEVAQNGGNISRLVLGPDLAAGARPQLVVPQGVWQAAQSLGAWTLVGCTVAPGFEFSGFEMAPKGWAPGDPRMDPSERIRLSNRDSTIQGDRLVYVRLLGEGTDVFRPVPATLLSGSKYILQGQEIFQPDDENWEFLPGTAVVTEKRALSGETVLVAVAKAT